MWRWHILPGTRGPPGHCPPHRYATELGISVACVIGFPKYVEVLQFCCRVSFFTGLLISSSRPSDVCWTWFIYAAISPNPPLFYGGHKVPNLASIFDPTRFWTTLVSRGARNESFKILALSSNNCLFLSSNLRCSSVHTFRAARAGRLNGLLKTNGENLPKITN